MKWSWKIFLKPFLAKLLFYVAIGKQSNFSDLQEVVKEAYKYDDIVFGDFQDSPLNISLKTIMEYKWLDQGFKKVVSNYKRSDSWFFNISLRKLYAGECSLHDVATL